MTFIAFSTFGAFCSIWGFLVCHFMRERQDKSRAGLTDAVDKEWAKYVYREEPDEFAVLLPSFEMEVKGDYMVFKRRDKPVALGRSALEDCVLSAMAEDMAEDLEALIIEELPPKTKTEQSYERIARRIKELDKKEGHDAKRN